MKIYLFDHLSQTVTPDFIGSIDKTSIESQCQELCIDIVSNELKYSANLWLLHCIDTDIYRNPSKITEEVECDQVLVFVTTSCGLHHENQIIHNHGKGRVLLFVKDMSILRQHQVMRQLCMLSFADAKKIVQEQNTYSIGWTEDPFFINSEIPLALYILCQCYLHLHYMQPNLSLSDIEEPQIRTLLENKELFGATPTQLKEIQSSNWWYTALSEEAIPWETLKDRGKAQWKALLSGDTSAKRFELWDSLILQIESSQDISLEVVKQYYLITYTLLSTKYGQQNQAIP
jgi:hypothetical protein